MSSKFDSDTLDNACEELFGHTNWAYGDTLTEEQLKEAHTTVVFFHNPEDETEEV